MKIARLAALGGSVVVSAGSVALAQSIQPAVFVINNVSHNVTSFTVTPGGQLNPVNTFPTGLNPQATALSPDGRLLAVSHGTQSEILEELLVFRVNPDATLTQVGQTLVPDSPQDVIWTSNDTLAVNETRLGGANQVRNFRFAGGAFTQLGISFTGGFSTRMDFHGPRNILYTQDTSGDSIRAIRVNPDGSLTEIDNEFTPPGMVNLGIAPDGSRMIGTVGALGATDREVFSFPVDASGALGPGPALVTESSERFPDDVAFSGDSRLVFVGHNDAEVVVSFRLDPVTGLLTNTGNSFDVGDTLSQGEVMTLGDLLFVLDESSALDNFQGIYTLRYDATGAMTVIDQDLTGGARPQDMAVWRGIPEPSMLGLVGAGALMLMRRKRA
jgi:6-phosphogluconolactonase (cycloisomerase 2 family)